MVYLHHRSCLPSIDHLRINHKGFSSKKVAVKPPQAKTMEYINEKIDTVAKAQSAHEQKQVSCGCTGDYSLRRLPNHDGYLNTPVEPMHLLKNISCETALWSHRHHEGSKINGSYFVSRRAVNFSRHSTISLYSLQRQSGTSKQEIFECKSTSWCRLETIEAVWERCFSPKI